MEAEDVLCPEKNLVPCALTSQSVPPKTGDILEDLAPKYNLHLRPEKTGSISWDLRQKPGE